MERRGPWILRCALWFFVVLLRKWKGFIVWLLSDRIESSYVGFWAILDHLLCSLPIIVVNFYWHHKLIIINSINWLLRLLSNWVKLWNTGLARLLFWSFERSDVIICEWFIQVRVLWSPIKLTRTRILYRRTSHNILICLPYIEYIFATAINLNLAWALSVIWTDILFGMLKNLRHVRMINLQIIITLEERVIFIRFSGILFKTWKLALPTANTLDFYGFINNLIQVKN